MCLLHNAAPVLSQLAARQSTPRMRSRSGRRLTVQLRPTSLRPVLKAACTRIISWTLSLCLLGLVPAVHAVKPEARDAHPTFPPKERVTLLVLGDTGEPGPEMETIRRAVSQEEKDAIVVLGDLIYPVGPKCPDGKLHRDAKRILDERTGGLLRGLGAPVLLLLGNHDVGGFGRNPEREACLIAYAAGEPDLILPDLSYEVDFGVLKLNVINTNSLDVLQARDVYTSWRNYDGWRVIAGHHVYRTFHDKAREDIVAPWLKMNRLVPDLYLNGHAHILQFGVYDRIPALTSGATAKTRERPSCPPECGAGQRFGASKAGYALVTFDPRSINVVFKDAQRKVLFTWSKKRKQKQGR